jgi:hypothetical protein
MGKWGNIRIGEDNYPIRKGKKSSVLINDDAFTPSEGRPWKLFKRWSDETDAAMQERILKTIAALKKVRILRPPRARPCSCVKLARVPRAPFAGGSCGCRVTCGARTIGFDLDDGAAGREAPARHIGGGCWRIGIGCQASRRR